MIVYIVLFKWNLDILIEIIVLVMFVLRGMKGKVLEIIDLFCGDNFLELF